MNDLEKPLTPEEKREKNLDAWGDAIRRQKVVEDVEKMPAPKELPKLEEQPTYEGDIEKESLDCVA